MCSDHFAVSDHTTLTCSFCVLMLFYVCRARLPHLTSFLINTRTTFQIICLKAATVWMFLKVLFVREFGMRLNNQLFLQIAPLTQKNIPISILYPKQNRVKSLPVI